jgi:hypothetical protein
MTSEKVEKHEYAYYNEDHVATQKDLKILGLELESKILNVKMELESKINSITIKLGTLIIASSGILFGLLTYFHK